MIRLKSLEVESFRAFGDPIRLDFDADIVLITGRNGFGKSSIFDAISWCLFGTSKRLAGTRDFTRADTNPFTNVFKSRGAERVKLDFRADGDSVLTVERNGLDLIVSDGVDDWGGASAQTKILNLLGYGPNEFFSGEVRRARDSFSRSFLLHQDLLSDFVMRDRPRERFDAFADLFSLTIMRDFYTHLVEERATARTNLVDLNNQYARARSDLERWESQEHEEQERLNGILASTDAGLTQPREQLARLLVDVQRIVPDFSPPKEPLDSIDTALVETSGLEARLESTLEEFSYLETNSLRLADWTQESSALSARLSGIASQLAEVRRRNSELSNTVDVQRQDLARLNSQIAARQTAAQALNDLLNRTIPFVTEDRCPICSRPMARADLVAHLRQRLETAIPQERQLFFERQTVTARLNSAQTELSALDESRTNLENQHSQIEEHLSRIQGSSSRLTQVWERRIGLPFDNRKLAEATGRAQATLKRVSEIRDNLQRLRPAFEMLEVRARLASIAGALATARESHDALVERTNTFQRIESLLDELIDASRKAERSILELFIAEHRESIEDVYRWLCPHPLFKELSFEFDNFDEFGELYLAVSHGDVRLYPAISFSSAQASALALAVFLAINRSQDWSDLRLTLIDDPVQSLDDVNILNLADLLRSIATERQVVISTSLPHLHRLLFDKLRPTHSGASLISHVFESLTEDGSVVTGEHITPEESPKVLPRLIELSA